MGSLPRPTPSVQHPGAAWAEYLDDLEARLDDLAGRSADTVRARTAFSPPTELGPLPAELATRAGALHRRLEAATTRVRDDVTATTGSLQQLAGLRTRGPAPAGALDTRL